MAGFRWTNTYRPRSRSGRYNAVDPDNPLLLWATDQLSSKWDRIRAMMREQRRFAQERVMVRSRVDTGLMKSEVRGIFWGGEVMNLEFGWDEGHPFYAPFQEYGTRNGIKPMRAVHQTFHEVWASVRTEVGR